ncbi:nSTAND1 domain-containing NTPase [Derxia lacustris]|uniref:nSTAND1 domain-containing NTPase n=1 Tax=Derxia lacustris TaxID=764842 RepID=UPI000A16F5D9|nr:winged helix-turn-helix domain-containing protein [Derxia lacustris]
MDRSRELPPAVPASPPFRFGDWQALPTENALAREGLRIQVEPRCMDVLLCLARAGGEVVSTDRLLDECWAGADIGDNPLHKTIAQLRRALGDSAVRPHYIETIRKRGYRLLQPVQFSAPAPAEPLPTLAPLSVSPFRGLAAFDFNHAASFFGRDRAIAELTERVDEQCAAGRGFVLLLGPSGCGKTSLLRAGLMARLGRLPDGAALRPAAVLPWRLDAGDCDQPPWQALAGALLAALPPAAEADAPATGGAGPVFDADWLAAAPDSAATALLARHAGGRAPAGRIYLLLDPFEALFTLPGFTPAMQAGFIAMLARLAASPRFFVLAACRNEFYPDITRLAGLGELRAGAGQYDVPTPTPGELAQMIRYPATAAGLAFEARPGGEHLDDVLRDAASRGKEVLPLLEYALDELYRSRSERGLLSFAAYDAMGGVEGAIGRRAEHTVAGLPPAAQAALGRLLSRLVVIGADDHVAGRRARFAELGDADERQLLDALVTARLVVTECFDGEPCFSASHEALFRHWPRVTDWVQRHRATLQLRARIAPLLARWLAEAESPDFLLPPGRQLDEAEELLTGTGLELTPDEGRWLAASARRARRLRQRRRLALAGLATLALVGSLLAALALDQRQAAETRRREAEALMSFMVGTLADKLRPIGRLELLEGVSDEALRFLAADRRDDDLPARMARARALQVGAEVEQARGQLDAAEQRLHAALALLPAAPAGIDDPALLRLLGELHFWIGQLHFDRRDWPAANAAFEHYRATAERWQQLRPDDRQPVAEVGYALNSLGSVALESDRIDEARLAFERSVRIKRQLRAGQEDDAQLSSDLADTLSWLGSTHARLLQPRLAEREQAEAIGLLLPIAERRPGEAYWQYEVAVLLALHAQALADLGDDATARQQLGQARGYLDRALAIDSGHPGWHRRAAQFDCADAALASDGAGAERQRRQARLDAAIARLLASASGGGSLLNRIDAGRCLGQQARLALADGDPAGADAALVRGLALLADAGSQAEPVVNALLRQRLALARRSGAADAEAATRSALVAALARLDAAPADLRDRLPLRLMTRLELASGAGPADLDSELRSQLEQIRQSGYRNADFTRLLAQRGLQ